MESNSIVLGGTGLLDNGPFYHGTKADLQGGDLLTAGFGSNYHSEVIMNHIYFTALANGAGLAAALAQGDGPERVYIVEPTGSFENDPNVTDKKISGQSDPLLSQSGSLENCGRSNRLGETNPRGNPTMAREAGENEGRFERENHQLTHVAE